MLDGAVRLHAVFAAGSLHHGFAIVCSKTAEYSQIYTIRKSRIVPTKNTSRDFSYQQAGGDSGEKVCNAHGRST